LSNSVLISASEADDKTGFHDRCGVQDRAVQCGVANVGQSCVE
jgi:hypothetical protein